MGTNHQDAPPSYDSMFGELAQKHAESDGVVDFTKEAAGVVNKKVSGIAGLICCGILCGLLGLAIPLTEIIIGSMYLKECPAERLLPIYLIVAGVFSMLSGSGTGGNRWASRNTDEGDDEEAGGGTKAKTGGCCGGLVGFFVLIWFICGNVFVFRMQECDSTQSLSINSTSVDCFTKDEAFSTADFYCHKLVYNYVYYSTIVKWAICGAITTIMILVCCCCCCFKCFGSRQEGSADIQASAANNPSYSA